MMLHYGKVRGSPWQSSGSEFRAFTEDLIPGQGIKIPLLRGEPYPTKKSENPLLSKWVELEMRALGTRAGCQDPGRRRGKEGRRRGCQRRTGKGLVPIPGRALDLVRLALGLNGNLTLGVLVCLWQK